VLRIAVIVCHALLAGTLAASIIAPAASWLRIGMAIAVTLPLLLAVRGLVLNLRATQQRVSVLLVLYVGGTAVEVVAHSGAAPLANIALLTAALELALLLVLIRRQAQLAPAARE
jgi:uncharacterized membrane protein